MEFTLIKATPFVMASFALFGVAGCATSPRPVSPPPQVTAKAWAIADGKTGKFLWGSNENEPRKSASTTKMMCAYVVLKLAEKEPSVLDERVTFSTLADNTPGSAFELKKGESLPVRDLLYGLLLPSGNDAGNALAEHLNSRFAPPDQAMLDFGLANTNLSTRVNFIAEMNRTARKLGLVSTKYRSPYGDGGTDDDRTTTARDLTRLAWNGMKMPLFRKYVGTRRYECQVQSLGGTTRTVAWENTNQLLGSDGYDGVKTGTTMTAGSCLVARGHRGNRYFITVVLGSNENEDRYSDTRALFEWAASESNGSRQ